MLHCSRSMWVEMLYRTELIMILNVFVNDTSGEVLGRAMFAICSAYSSSIRGFVIGRKKHATPRLRFCSAVSEMTNAGQSNRGEALIFNASSDDVIR